MRKILIVLLLSILLVGCGDKTKEEVFKALTPTQNEEIKESAKKIIGKDYGDYQYWTLKTLNETDEFWDMASNTGTGCTTGNLVYYTQVINPVEIGYPVGYPIEEYVETMVTEENVLFSMAGITLGEWCNTGEKEVKYDSFKCIAYITQDLIDRDWVFISHTYTVTEGKEGKPITYFNIMGLTEYKGDWITSEITGNYTENEDIITYKEIIGEFVEIYGLLGNIAEDKTECINILLGS